MVWLFHTSFSTASLLSWSYTLLSPSCCCCCCCCASSATYQSSDLISFSDWNFILLIVGFFSHFSIWNSDACNLFSCFIICAIFNNISKNCYLLAVMERNAILVFWNVILSKFLVWYKFKVKKESLNPLKTKKGQQNCINLHLLLKVSSLTTMYVVLAAFMAFKLK